MAAFAFTEITVRITPKPPFEFSETRIMLEKGKKKNPNLDVELAKFRKTVQIECLIERYREVVTPSR
jgi:hypothetical protein